MRFLIISIFFFITSCSLPSVKGYLKQEIPVKEITNNYFANTEIDYIYKANINYLKNSFSGLLIIKKIGDRHKRIVFTTEFGNKIFDFEIINDNFKVNYILGKLNKKIIINALKKDFLILIKNRIEVTKKFTLEKKIIYKTNKKPNLYYFFDENNRLAQIIWVNINKEKVVFSFKNIEEPISKNIRISHKKYGFTIDLKYIGK